MIQRSQIFSHTDYMQRCYGFGQVYEKMKGEETSNQFGHKFRVAYIVNNITSQRSTTSKGLQDKIKNSLQWECNKEGERGSPKNGEDNRNGW